jgi:hypothetical protein
MRDGRARWVAVALVAASGGAQCARGGGAPPERLVPVVAPWALVVPKLRAAQEEAAPLLRTVLTFPAAANLAESVAAIQGQLGFDPLDPRALAEAGLDADRGAALVATNGGTLLLVLPAADAGKLDAFLARAARERLGAARRETVDVGGARVDVFRRAAGAPPALAVASAGGAALVAAGEAGPRAVAAAASLTEGASLRASPAYAKARAALGEGVVAILFAPPGSPALAPWVLARDGAALGALASSTRLELRTALLLPGARAAAWHAALPDGAASAGADALARLPGDAFLAARSGADPSVLTRLAWALPDGTKASLARAGLNLERDVAGVFAPGAALGVALAPTFEVAAVSRGRLDAAERDPFRLVHVAAVIEVRDAARARALLERLARASPELGVKVEARAAGALPAWRIARRGTELAVALDGKRLLVAGGPGRLDALLARRDAAYAAPTPASRAALEGAAAAAVLDLGRLVRSFRALPAAAYGTGPDAFVMRSLAERVVDPASRLAAASLSISMARLDGAGEAVRLDVVVEAREPGSDAR